jgi:hypothetical protein
VPLAMGVQGREHPFDLEVSEQQVQPSQSLAELRSADLAVLCEAYVVVVY